MAKKKTRVMLPGGIQGLVHDLQNGTSRFAQQPIVDATDTDDAAESSDETPDTQEKANEQVAPENQEVRMEVTPAETTSATEKPAEIEKPAQTDKPSVDAAEAAEKRGEPRMREYHIVKDDSKDSWDLFIDMARQYKSGGGKLATIYIDETLKSVLDRMKYAGTEKLSTSAILSSIVARFVYDHEDEIRKVLFSGDLL